MDTVECLINEFDESLGFFESNMTDGFESHLRTMRLRKRFSSVSDAIDDDEFLESLRTTLSDWKLRRAGLLALPNFARALRGQKHEIQALEQWSLESPPDTCWSAVWRVIALLSITRRVSRLVSGTKALHHILPNLVVPIDRVYTGAFLFAYQQADFSAGAGEQETFRVAFHGFSRIAAAIQPNVVAYRNRHAAHTSITKLIDNAIFGFVGRARAQLWQRTVP